MQHFKQVSRYMQQNFVSQRTAESLGQQGFFQLVQGGEFALVEPNTSNRLMR